MDGTITAMSAPEQSPASAALADVREGFARVYMWAGLGWLDVRQRYTGSLLGSLWLTANMTLMVGGLTLVFAAPLGSKPGAYAGYVTCGLVLWSLIQTTLNEAALVFVNAAETLRQCKVPHSVQLFRLIWRNLIVFAHAAVLVPVVLAFFRIVPSIAAWTVLPALLLLFAALFFAALLLSLLGTRFRDVPQVVTNALQLMFFVTPIFWLPRALSPGKAWLLQFNPLFAFIDIVRAPLLGGHALDTSWPIALATTLVLAIVGAAAYARWRARLVYWV